MSFTQLGAGATLASTGPQPAQIEFVGRFLKSIRNAPEKREQSLGIVEGEIWLEGKPPRAHFRPTSESLKALSQGASAPPSDTGASAEAGIPRALDLIFDPSSFEPCPSVAPQLLLPDFTPQYRYLEVLAELKIAGATEAAPQQNDVLDVPIWRDSPPLARAYVLQVIDEVGQPIAGAELELVCDGDPVPRTTDASGLVTVLTQNTARAPTSFTKPDEVVSELKTRWGKVRKKRLVPLEAEVIQRYPEALDSAFEVEPGTRQIVCIRPHVSMARMLGAYFDTNKCFLLPSAVPTMKKLVELYESEGVTQQETGVSQPTQSSEPETELLIIGHTDTSGTPDYNQTLSEERAESMAAFLKNDVDGWLAWFGSGKADKKRWGHREELMMMLALVEPRQWLDSDLISAYQNWHNERDSRSSTRPLPAGWQPVTVTGEVDDATRRQLVIDYMDIDGTSLADDVPVTCVGCGERYPVGESDAEIDDAALDGQHEQADRRVEVLFFARSHGIVPPATGPKESGQYPAWRERAAVNHILDALAEGNVTLRIHNRQLEPTTDEVVVFRFGNEWAVGVTDEGGLVEFPGPPPNVCTSTELHWGSPEEKWAPEHLREVLFGCGQDDGKDRDWARLHDLGYEQRDIPGLIMSKFRWTYGLEQHLDAAGDSPPDDIVEELKSIWVDRTCVATPTKGA